MAPLANRAAAPYLGAMALTTPPDIAGGLKDFWNYIRVDRPHRWPALGLALTVPAVVLYFMIKGTAPEPERRSIIYVESWSGDRSDFDVRRAWLIRALEANDLNQRRRNNYGEVAKVIGQTYDSRRADAEFDAARATIRRALADLDEAEAKGLPLPPLPRAASEPAATPTPATPTAPTAPSTAE